MTLIVPPGIWFSVTLNCAEMVSQYCCVGTPCLAAAWWIYAHTTKTIHIMSCQNARAVAEGENSDIDAENKEIYQGCRHFKLARNGNCVMKTNPELERPVHPHRRLPVSQIPPYVDLITRVFLHTLRPCSSVPVERITSRPLMRCHRESASATTAEYK